MGSVTDPAELWDFDDPVASEQRFREAAIEIDHHVRDAGFGGRGAALGDGETELTLNRGLHAVAVQPFAFDGGSVDGLMAETLDAQALAVGGVQMFRRPDNDARAFGEGGFRRNQLARVPAEVRPIRMPPVPHDR